MSKKQHWLSKGSVQEAVKPLYAGFSLEEWLQKALTDLNISPGGAVDFSTLPSYANNATAVADLGVGKLYKSSSLFVEESPVILITV